MFVSSILALIISFASDRVKQITSGRWFVLGANLQNALVLFCALVIFGA